MKKTVKIEKLATAMNRSEQEFREILPSLKALGFPSPVEASPDEFHIEEVMDWVTEHQALTIKILTLAAERLLAKS